MTRAVLGKEFKLQEAFKDNIKKIISLIAGFSVVDVFPSIKVFHLINTISPKFKKLRREVDEILECIIREHKANMEIERTTHFEKVEDLLSVLLHIQDKGNDLNKVPLTDNIIEADLFLAGSEASSISAEWTMSELMREPRVMEKAKAEVRQVFDSEGKVEESKLNQLKYLHCVIKETYKLHPIAPLLAPRESREKCKINGRKCPGESFGHQAIALMLANLLIHFDWKLPDGQNPQDLDTTEVDDVTKEE
ncbi:hypothetical protein ACFE04_016118 [Oxalis oulophora]